MRLILALAFMLFATPALAQTPAGEYPTMDAVGLAWERAPSIQRMGQLFPRVAWQAGHRRGLARVVCTPQSNGRLRCSVLEEDPGDVGFGRAAVQVMDRAIVRATDGGPVADRTFAFTLRFGYWPPRLLPDIYHPTEAGLRWIVSPSLGEWDGNDNPGFRGRATIVFDCTARADGSLDCHVVSYEPEGIDAMIEAALATLAEARVARIDGGSPEGVRFRWAPTWQMLN